MKTYSVELRNYTSDGSDYIEEHYDFTTRSEAMQFAKRNRRTLYSVLEYQPHLNYNPKDITPY